MLTLSGNAGRRKNFNLFFKDEQVKASTIEKRAEKK
jgi:hypothetical protein